MVLSILKSGDKLFDQGVDSLKRRDYGEARQKFQLSLEKSRGSDTKTKLTRVYLAMIDVFMSRGAYSKLGMLADILESTDLEPFEFGISVIDPKEMIVECRLAVERGKAMEARGGTRKGEMLLDLSKRYYSEIGQKNLILSEIFRNDNTLTGIRQAQRLQAIGYEELAYGIVEENPKKAAEYLQMAYNLKRQLGEDTGLYSKLMKDYSRSAKCWICGRVSTGEGIHFMPVVADISPMVRSSGEDMVKTMSDDHRCIYMCKPCYSSMSTRAEEISQMYYQMAMREIRRIEMEMEAKITAMRGSSAAIGGAIIAGSMMRR